jgi:hypothetical protein
MHGMGGSEMVSECSDRIGQTVMSFARHEEKCGPGWFISIEVHDFHRRSLAHLVNRMTGLVSPSKDRRPRRFPRLLLQVGTEYVFRYGGCRV